MQLSRTRRWAAALTLPLLIGAGALSSTQPAAAAAKDPQKGAPPATYAGNAEAQSALVDAEEERVQDIRTKASILRWENKNAYQVPQCDVKSAVIPTCILVPRDTAYTLADLMSAEMAFAVTEEPDGSLLLNANLFVPYRATLSLGGTHKTLHMRSDAKGFTSIVSYGGKIDLHGTATAPLKITSWDEQSHTVDTKTEDGRAYIRAIGGQFTMSYSRVESLGFWSGKTGGVAMTGTDRPNVLAVTRQQPKGKTARDQEKDAAKAARRNQRTGADLGLTPASALEHLKFGVEDNTLVSGSVTNSTISGDAYGLFVSGAKDIQVLDTVVEKSLVDGVTLHRYVATGKIEKTKSRLNAGNGFVLARATQSVTINQATAEANRGDGFKLSGEPLADGPSATGTDTRSYGNNSINYSVSHNNGRYGVEIVGGTRVTVSANIVTSNDMGIVASGDANDVTIVGNQITSTARQGITLRDGVRKARVSGNSIDKVGYGIYLRAVSAEVFGNTVHRASNHGITLVGDMSGSSVTGNILSGRGPSAIDSHRLAGKVTLADNAASNWVDTTALWGKIKRLIHPMTVIWVLLLLLLAVTAVRGRRARGVMGHPYADKRLTVPQAVVPLPTAFPRTSVPEDARTIDLRVPAGAVRASHSGGALANGNGNGHPNGHTGNGQAQSGRATPDSRLA